MKKLTFIGLLALIVQTASAQKFAFSYSDDFNRLRTEAAAPEQAGVNQQNLDRFVAADTTLKDEEVLKLLIAQTTRSNYQPYNLAFTEVQTGKLNEEGKFAEALALCDSILQIFPFSTKALIEGSFACFKLNKPDSSRNLAIRFNRIMRAVARSGTGTDPEHAFFALSPMDPPLFISRFLDAKVGDITTTRDIHNLQVDMVEMKWPDPSTGQPQSRVLYFYIDHAAQTMSKDVKSASEQKESPAPQPEIPNTKKKSGKKEK
ncbi:MAG: DUF4919 domain-containing protein [Flavobacteriales bacterium]|nr:DUF4919 domain-containing protein [Flavobacteriales bacterium]MCB9447644.1 DUF4919 domain-containing protein [Flavobacteriales bacterium]